MKWIHVWVTLPDGVCLPAGDMVCEDPDKRGRVSGEFRYHPQYLGHPKAFPLDPVSLPLGVNPFACDRPCGVHGVFEDSLPDDWGRNLLVRKAGLQRREWTIPNLLLALGSSGLGALSYTQEGAPLPVRADADMISLTDLLRIALRYDAGEPVPDDEMAMLFQAASSPGGARPKALIADAAGDQWMVKFPSRRDRLNMVVIEAATMALARQAGLNVSETKIMPCARRKVLLIKRFDIRRMDIGLPGRRHMISMQTLLCAEGVYRFGYHDLFEIIRKYSAQPEIDIHNIFSQMTFNALIGNTDDHLKNFTIIHDDHGYFLSPAYDLMPDTTDRREHVLHFNGNYIAPGSDELKQIGKMEKVSGASEIVDRVRESLVKWQSVFESFAVPKADIARLSWGIERHLAK
ncbi:MAG: type II toxin-antitoxin system HipA family toxin [Desulfosalsimonadaceae bacterium]